MSHNKSWSRSLILGLESVSGVLKFLILESEESDQKINKDSASLILT